MDRALIRINRSSIKAKLWKEQHKSIKKSVKYEAASLSAAFLNSLRYFLLAPCSLCSASVISAMCFILIEEMRCSNSFSDCSLASCADTTASTFDMLTCSRSSEFEVLRVSFSFSSCSCLCKVSKPFLFLKSSFSVKSL